MEGVKCVAGGPPTATPPVVTAGVSTRGSGFLISRASDLPDEHEKNLMNANDAMSKEDAALNKKIKSICRGC